MLYSKQFATLYISSNARFFPNDRVESLIYKLEKLPESNQAYILRTPLKDPNTTLILSLIMGVMGLDRFYIGDKVFGTIKLLLSISLFTMILEEYGLIGELYTYFASNSNSYDAYYNIAQAKKQFLETFQGINFLFAAACFIFSFIDIYLCFNKTKEINYSNVLNVLP